MGYFGRSYKGSKGANGSDEPIVPIPIKYLSNPPAAHPSTPSTRPASPPKTPTSPPTPSDKGTKRTHSESRDEVAEEEISPPMKFSPPRGKRRKVASVPFVTRTSSRLKLMNNSGNDEHPVTKGSKTSGRGGGKGKKAK